MNYAAETKRNRNFARLSEKVRLVLGLMMMFSGLYVGVISGGAGEGLGLLSVMISPFVMIADK
jgi:hypothetical protein